MLRIKLSLEPHNGLPERETLHAALCYLMTRFYFHPCHAVAAGVVDHLRLLLEHPDSDDSAAEQETYRMLFERWKLIERLGTSTQPNMHPLHTKTNA